MNCFRKNIVHGSTGTNQKQDSKYISKSSTMDVLQQPLKTISTKSHLLTVKKHNILQVCELRTLGERSKWPSVCRQLHDFLIGQE